MRIHVVSIFPEMFRAIADYGVTGRAISQRLVSLKLWDPRDFATDRHRSVDDRPYGGGPGMVMMAPPLAAAIEAARMEESGRVRVVYMSPQGDRLDHLAVQRFAGMESVILLAGRYEGVDERLLARHVDEECSIGDYVLSGGELAVMVWIDAVTRQLPGTLGNAESADQDSFAGGLLDCGHYTRPDVYAGIPVPEVLRSGDHGAIRRWRLKQALGRTWRKHPELLEKIELNDEQLELLAEYQREHELEKGR
jgi:tRNA (guanine37-N1)-methyltransferase